MKTQPGQPELVSAEAVASHFGVTIATIRRWTRERIIPCLRPTPRVIRYRLADVCAALAQGSRERKGR